MSKKKKLLIIVGTLLAVVVIAVLAVLIINPHEHFWMYWEVVKEATCTSEGLQIAPCAVCGKEIDSQVIPITHSWEEATCYESKTCKICNTKEGSALGHNWIGATCARPKYCSRCGLEEGTVNDNHNYSYGRCTVCYESMELNIILPKAPLTIERYSDLFKFTKFDYSYEFTSNNKFKLWLWFDGEVVLGDGPFFYYINIYDSDGYLVESVPCMIEGLRKGDKVRDQREYIGSGFDSSETYTIVIVGY